MQDARGGSAGALPFDDVRPHRGEPLLLHSLFAQPSSNPDLVMYRLDDVHRLLLGHDAALLINTQERVVVMLSSAARRLGPIVLWPRDVMQGVVLGDGVKGDEADSYHFGDGSVDIR